MARLPVILFAVLTTACAPVDTAGDGGAEASPVDVTLSAATVCKHEELADSPNAPRPERYTLDVEVTNDGGEGGWRLRANMRWESLGVFARENLEETFGPFQIGEGASMTLDEGYRRDGWRQINVTLIVDSERTSGTPYEVTDEVMLITSTQECDSL